MITILFLMLFTTALYIEWGLKQDQKQTKPPRIAPTKHQPTYQRKAS